VSSDRHQRVKQIFLEACERDKSSRAAFLCGACGDDDELRLQVESLLEHHRDDSIFPAPPAAVEPQRKSAGSQRSRSRGSGASLRRFMVGWTERLGFAGQLALCAAVTMLVVFGLNWWSQRYTDALARRMLETNLSKLSETADDLVVHWLDAERRSVEAMQAVPSFRVALNVALNSPPAAVGSPPVERPDLDRAAAMHGGAEAAYLVFNRRGTMTAYGGNPNLRPPTVPDPALQGELRRVLGGESHVYLPHRCRVFAGNNWFGLNKPMVGAIAPVVGDGGQIFGAFFVASPARLEALNEALRGFRVAASGEAFLCSPDGRMLNESRFRDELVQSGVLPSGATSTVLMSLHDPGGDLTKGHRPVGAYSSHVRPAAVASIQAGVDGVNVDGYRDYRGVPVVGAWRTNPRYDYGLIVKTNYDEAFAPFQPLSRFVVARMALVAAALGLLLWSWCTSASLRRRLKRVVQIGPYALEGLIGEGGMGRVYRARHLLLKRATAVKVIKPELVNERTIGWFEREVEMAGRLKHPNTVEIYDFGRSADGQFYCAMEFLNGLNLSQITALEGALPAARAIHVMRHAAHSLHEAHRRGMVHRDIKPQNIMLCVLGGEADVVKVLDFGLAKQFDGTAEKAETKMLAGTPLYLAPERLKPPFTADRRSDIYSLGMTVYKLLTGRDVFSGGSDLEVFHQTLNVPVPHPSRVVSQVIPPEFADLVMACLEKDPAARPQSLGEVVSLLDRLAVEYPWMSKDAIGWWQTNSERVRALFPLWDPDEQLAWETTTPQAVVAKADSAYVPRT
jgi:eukaryotic-like serine/threonine-protein kinase